MFGWLKGEKIEPTAVVEREIKAYIARCEGCSNEEMANLLLRSDMRWKQMQSHSIVSQKAFDIFSIEGDKLRRVSEKNIEQIIKAFQRKNDFEGAAGCIVWIMSLRALLYPENRILGKLMWAHFMRSMHIAFEMIQEQENIDGDPFFIIEDPSRVLFVPEVLIPSPDELPRDLVSRISIAWASSEMGAQLGRVPMFAPFWELRP